jgi:hypothetical protein
MTKSADVPVMPRTIKLKDLLLAEPTPAPLNEDPFRGLASQPDMIPPTDTRGTTANPSMQLPSRQGFTMQHPSMEDRRSKSGIYGALANTHGSQLRYLQTSSNFGILPTPTTYMKYGEPQRSGMRANCPDPLVLPEVPQLPPMLSSPFMPFDSGLAPPVPPKSGYNMLPLPPPLHESVAKPPPVPPKDNFNPPTHGAIRSANALRPHLLRYPYPQLAAPYPQKPLPPMLEYDDVEDLALDSEEQQNANVPFSEPVHHWLLPMESFSGPSTAMVPSSEVNTESSLSQNSARPKCLPNRCRCECHQDISSDPATTDSAETKRANQKSKAEVLTRNKAIVKAARKRTKLEKGEAARLTAIANAGKSNYMPRTKRPRNQPWPVDAEGKMYPIEIVYPYNKAQRARDRRAGIHISSDEDTDDE